MKVYAIWNIKEKAYCASWTDMSIITFETKEKAERFIDDRMKKDKTTYKIKGMSIGG